MRAWIAAIVFAIVLVAAFVVFAFDNAESPAPQEATATSSAAGITEVSATDSYHAGVHTVKGTATVPTACTPLVATTSVFVSTTTAVRVDLSAEADTGLCLEVPTVISWSVTAEATSTAEVDIYVNGMFATTTP